MSEMHWKTNDFINTPSSRPLRASILTVATVLMGLIVFSWFYEINLTVVAEGKIVAFEGEKTIVAANAGTLKKLLAEVGSPVKKGQVLGLIEIPYSSEESVERLLIDLNKKLKELEAYFPDPNKEFPTWTAIRSENPVLMKLVAQAETSWTQYRIADRGTQGSSQKQLKLLNLQIQRGEEKIKILKKSSQAKMLVSVIEEIEEKTQAYLVQKQEILDQMKSKLEQSRSETLATLRMVYAQAYEFYDSYRLKAYSDGVISQVLVNKNQFITKDQPIFNLIANSSQFEVLLQVPSGKAAKVESQQEVRIAVESFPYQRYGHFNGSVISVDQSINTSTGSSESFSVRTSIQQPEHRDRFPAGEIRLMPGVKVLGYIKTRKISIAYLLYEKIFSKDEP
jgi:membrane fusion protein